MATKKRGNPVTVRGPWFAMPLDFLRSRACAELSPLALKMLMDLCSQFGWNAKGNGDLSAAPTILRARGWTGNGSRVAALQELEAAGLVVKTRQGNRKLCGLYACTLWPMDCDFTKLDHGPGCYSTADWEAARAGAASTPTHGAPAKWQRARGQKTFGGPVAGKQVRKGPGYEPAAG